MKTEIYKPPKIEMITGAHAAIEGITTPLTPKELKKKLIKYFGK